MVKRRGLMRSRILTSLVLVMAISLGFIRPVNALNPSTISFQGKVVNASGTNVADGTYSFLFKLYTVSSAGTAIWSETQSPVSVVAGTFQVNLGSVCPFFTAATCNNNTVIDFNANPALYLGITFNGDPAGEMTPRVQLQSVPYAYNADKVGGLSVSQLVQLSPASQQSGSLNLSGNGTFGGGVQGATITSTGVLQGNSLSLNSGAFAVSSSGAITATTGIAASGVVSVQTSSYVSDQVLLNDGQTTAPPTYPNSYTPALSIVTSEASGARPLFIGYNNGSSAYAAFLTAGSCGAFTQMCLDFGNGTTASTALENVGGVLQVGGGADGSFTTVALAPLSGNVGVGTTTPGFKLDVSGTLNASAAATLGSTLTVSGLATFNSGVSLAANQNLTLQSGTGTINQTYSNSLSGTADNISATNSNASSTVATVNGVGIQLVGGTNTTANANNNNGINFAAVTPVIHNNFNGLVFGTGYTNLLQSANVTITAAGAITAGTYNGQTLSSAASFTGSVNAVSGFNYNGTAGASVSCPSGDYLNAEVVQGGILTGDGGCAGAGLSDERLKTDIIPLSNDVLNQIKNVNPVTFYYQCSNSYFASTNTYCDPNHQTGVLAQQLMQIFPDLVHLDQYGYYHVNYQGLSIDNLKATSELAQHLDAAGNANLNVVSATSLTVNGNTTLAGNLTVYGTTNFAGGISYSSLSSPIGSFSSHVLTPQLTANGALQINSGATGDVSIDSAGGSVIIGSQTVSGLALSRSGQTTQVNGALSVQQSTDFNGPVTMNFTTASELKLVSNLSGTTTGFSIIGSPSDSTGTKQGILIQQANTSGSQSDGLNGALVIDNANSTTPIGAAIMITNSGGGGYSKLISSPVFNVDSSGNTSTTGSIQSASLEIGNAAGQVASIDSKGNASFAAVNLSSASLSGGLIVGGDATFQGLTNFQKLATFFAKTIFRQDVQFEGHITVASDSAGYASLRAGETKVHISFSLPYATPPIVNAQILNGIPGSVGIDNITAQGFDLSLFTPAKVTTTLSWTAVAVDNPITSTNPLSSTVQTTPAIIPAK